MKSFVALLAIGFGTTSPGVASAASGQQSPRDGDPDSIPYARIAVSALHGPIRLSTLAGAPEHAIIEGNVNAQDWSPGGDRLVYVDDRGNGEYALSVADTFGRTTRLPVPMRSTWPQHSRDGRWIYFFTQDDRPPQVYRIAPDGTGLQHLLLGSFPAPAPDGTRIAITVEDGIWVGDPLTRDGWVVQNTTSDAFATRWSPDGRWIAYRQRGGGVILIRPDGTGKRTISAPPIGGLSWSPDGSWILGGNVDGGPLQLIDTRTDGARFLSVRGVYPAWKPTGAGLMAQGALRRAAPTSGASTPDRSPDPRRDAGATELPR
jgi:hypothetical protein